MPYYLTYMGFLNWINSHAGLITVSTLFAGYVYRNSKKAKLWITTVNDGMINLADEIKNLKDEIGQINNKLDHIQQLITHRNASRN